MTYRTLDVQHKISLDTVNTSVPIRASQCLVENHGTYAFNASTFGMSKSQHEEIEIFCAMQCSTVGGLVIQHAMPSHRISRPGNTQLDIWADDATDVGWSSNLAHPVWPPFLLLCSYENEAKPTDANTKPKKPQCAAQ